MKTTSRSIVFSAFDGIPLKGRLWESARSPSPSVLVVCRSAQPLSHLADFAHAVVRLGYSFFAQSVRGRGNSGGSFQPFSQEWLDSFTMVHGLLGSDFLGRRGLLPVGLGYDGQSALTLCIATPVELVSGLAVAGASSSLFHAGLAQNGLMLGEELYRLTRFLPPQERPGRAAFTAWLENPRWSEGHSPFAARPQLERWLLTAMRTPLFHSFWRQQALCPQRYIREFPDAPAFVATGGRAASCAGALDLAQRLAGRNANSVEIHWGDWDAEALEDYRPDSPVAQRLLDWLANLPQKRGRAAARANTVHCLVHDLSGHKPFWQRWHTWPSLEMSLWELFLDSGRLCANHPRQASQQEFLDNPMTPPPSPQDQWGFTPTTPCFGEYKLPLSIRSDTIAYASEPLTKPLTLLGTPRLRLRIVSNRPDTHILARLIAAPPDGPPLTLSYGGARLALRYGAENLVAFSAATDVSTTISFPLQPLAWRLAAGTRLRLEIASHDFPRYCLGNNALPRQGQLEAPPRSARNAVEADARGTSRLVLPVWNRAPP